MFSVVIDESGSKSKLTFHKSEIVIGRIRGNDIILPKGNVSKQHCQIRLESGNFIVKDLGSTNGTFVNGYKVTSPTTLREGDRVFVGDFILTLFSETASSPQVAPPPQIGASSSGIQPTSDPSYPSVGTVDARNTAAPQPPPPMAPQSANQATNPPMIHGGPTLQPPVKLTAEPPASAPPPIQLQSSPPLTPQEISQPPERPSRPSPPIEASIPSSSGNRVSSSSIRLKIDPEDYSWLKKLLEEEDIDELFIDFKGQTWIDHSGGLMRSDQTFSSYTSFRGAAQKILQKYSSGQAGFAAMNASASVRQWTVPDLGTFVLADPPMSPFGTTIRMSRKIPSPTADVLIEEGIMSPVMLQHVRQAISEDKNILIVGGAASSQKQILSYCLTEVSESRGILLVERTPQIFLDRPFFKTVSPSLQESHSHALCLQGPSFSKQAIVVAATEMMRSEVQALIERVPFNLQNVMLAVQNTSEMDTASLGLDHCTSIVLKERDGQYRVDKIKEMAHGSEQELFSQDD